MKAVERQATPLEFFLIFSGTCLFCGCLSAFINEAIFADSMILQMLTSLSLVLLMAIWYAVDEDQDRSVYPKAQFFVFGLIVALSLSSFSEYSTRAIIDYLE